MGSAWKSIAGGRREKVMCVCVCVAGGQICRGFGVLDSGDRGELCFCVSGCLSYPGWIAVFVCVL